MVQSSLDVCRSADGHSIIYNHQFCMHVDLIHQRQTLKHGVVPEAVDGNKLSPTICPDFAIDSLDFWVKVSFAASSDAIDQRTDWRLTQQVVGVGIEAVWDFDSVESQQSVVQNHLQSTTV